MVILDTETDNLYPDVTVMHCAVAYDIDKDIYTEFTPRNIHLLPAYLDSVDELSMHNGIGFDLKVLKKLFNYEYKGNFIDTLLLSRILWPDIEPSKYVSGEKDGVTIYGSVKGHSIDAWGIRLGISKPKYEDWSTFTPEMLHRCKEDVKIQTQLYLKCKNTMKRFQLKDSRLNNWESILELEQSFWRGMEVQAGNGWLLDIDKTDSMVKRLNGELSQIGEQLVTILPPVLKKPYKETTCIAFKKDGSITTNALNWCESNPPSGDFCRVKFEPLNLNSPEQLKDFLLKEGWIPAEYNHKKDPKTKKPIRDNKGNLMLTTPKTPKEVGDWEGVAKQINKPAINLLANRAKIKHRYGLFKGLLENVRHDRRIEARMISCGCNTARAQHMIVVNIPKAEDKIYLGKECRSVFTVPEGKILVGGDASALEARCEAHYLYQFDKFAANELVNGDIHILNSKIWNVERSLAKNGKYALTYGCSPDKLAATLKKPTTISKELYNAFWDNNPGLKVLKQRLEEQYESKGYLVAIDGRPLSIRYKHALLNTLLQSAGAIAMKKAWCVFDEWRVKEGLQREILDVGNFHDEMQIETTPDLADIVGAQIVTSIQKAGELLKFNVPLTGEYKVGMNWAETH